MLWEVYGIIFGQIMKFDHWVEKILFLPKWSSLIIKLTKTFLEPKLCLMFTHPRLILIKLIHLNMKMNIKAKDYIPDPLMTVMHRIVLFALWHRLLVLRPLSYSPTLKILFTLIWPFPFFLDKYKIAKLLLTVFLTPQRMFVKLYHC